MTEKMRTLGLLRHGKARADHGEGDFARALKGHGRRQILHMARVLCEAAPPQRLLVSTAQRTRETAQILLEEFAGAVQVEHLDALYLASPQTLLECIARVPDNVQRVLVVGHNPGLSELAQSLLWPERLADLPTGSLVELDTGLGWSQLVRGGGRLRRWLDPDEMDLS